MAKPVYCLFGLLLNYGLLAQEGLDPDPLSMAVSGTAVCYPAEIGLLGIPAFNSELPYAGMAYSNRFLISDLSTVAVCGGLPSWGGFSSFALSYFGTGDYNQSRVAYTFGYRLFPWLSAGIRINGYRYEVQAVNRNAWALSGDIGMQLQTPEGWTGAINLVNPNRSRYYSDSGQSLPSELRVGTGWYQNREYYLGVQFNWIDYSRFNLSFGAEYWIQKVIAIRGGIAAGQQLNYSFGLATVYQCTRFEMGFQKHCILGMSSALAVYQTFGKQ